MVTPRTTRRATRLCGLAAIFVAFALDQATKLWALAALGRGDVYAVPPIFNLRLSFHQGISFSLFTETFTERPLMLAGITLAMTALLGVQLLRSPVPMHLYWLGGNFASRRLRVVMRNGIRRALGRVTPDRIGLGAANECCGTDSSGCEGENNPVHVFLLCNGVRFLKTLGSEIGLVCDVHAQKLGEGCYREIARMFLLIAGTVKILNSRNRQGRS